MSEISGVGPEVGLFGRIRRAVGLSPRAPRSVPTPAAPPVAPQPDTLREIVQGVQDPATGELRKPDPSWKHPADRNLMGETRATSPGAEILKATQAGLPVPPPAESKEAYVVPGTEQDNQPIASQAPEATTLNTMPFPPVDKPAA